MSDSELHAQKQLFIKGFKIDREKIKKRFNTKKGDPAYARILFTITDWVPREAYLYIGVGIEQDESFSSVFVLDDGYDREALEKMSMPQCHKELLEAREYLTAGVWPLWE